jgi:hypothetical protein
MTTPGRSEFSPGRGYVPDPRSDFQQGRQNLPFAEGPDKKDMVRDEIARKRTDPTNSQEVIFPDMYYAEGNPDQFGPGPALVQEPVNRPVGVVPQPVWRYGVAREG